MRNRSIRSWLAVGIALCSLLPVGKATGSPAQPEGGEPDATSESFHPLSLFSPVLINRMPDVLSWQNPETGIFETSEWQPSVKQELLVTRNQDIIATLAALWAYDDPDNPYFHDEEVFAAIIAGGDALAREQEADGTWLYRKPDGSTWGYLECSFTVIRWLRAYLLVEDYLDKETSARWSDSIQKSLAHIYAKPTFSNLDFRALSNHLLNESLMLYLGGKHWNKPEWVEAGTGYIRFVIANQDPEGFFWEAGLPVPRYGGVYLHCLGMYYAESGDPAALEALEKAARYYWLYTYPNGRLSAVMDGRNHYKNSIRSSYLGLAMTPEGRALMRRTYSGKDDAIASMPLDAIGHLLQFPPEETSVSPPAGFESDFSYLMANGLGFVERSGKWIVYLSAYTSPGNRGRWLNELQNYVSIYHEDYGLILGGGNTKGNPRWSTYSVGHVHLVQMPDEEDRLLPKEKLFPGGIHYFAGEAEITVREGRPVLSLNYFERDVTLGIEIIDDEHLKIEWAVEGPETSLAQFVRFTFIPRFGEELSVDGGSSIPLDRNYDGKMICLDSESQVVHFGDAFKVSADDFFRVCWPVMAYNPYVKSGKGSIWDSRIVLEIPVSEGRDSGHVFLRTNVKADTNGSLP